MMNFTIYIYTGYVHAKAIKSASPIQEGSGKDQVTKTQSI